MGRRPSPLEDAAVVRAVRRAVGDDVALRVDANRLWALSDAVVFGQEVADCGLQFIEVCLNRYSFRASGSRKVFIFEFSDVFLY